MLGLAGCSVLRLAYSQADELSFWWLDGYVDFDDSQSPRVRDAIGRWFAWHRRTQLPDYAALLDRAATEVLQDTTPATACRWFADLRQRADAAVDQALPEAAAIAAGFSTDQLLHIERQQAKNSAEFREDFLQPDPAERLARSVERATERAEQLYGRLGERQRQRIGPARAGGVGQPGQHLVGQRIDHVIGQRLGGAAGDLGGRGERAGGVER